MERKTEKMTRVLIIGGGPGGYVAAIRASQLGASVTLVEQGKIGGACLNVGCIPTKALLHAASYVNTAQDAERCGVHLKLERVDFAAVQAHKDSIVKQLTGGVAGLLRANQVKVIEGTARLTGAEAVSVRNPDGGTMCIEADRIILATGSAPVLPPVEGLRESAYAIDSAGALALTEIPKRLLVIGGGVIGAELAAAFRSFGSETTIVEALPRLAPSLDGEMSQLLLETLRKQGITVYTDSRVVRVTDTPGGAEALVRTPAGTQTLVADQVLAAVGRRPATSSLNLDGAGIRHTGGRIEVNERMETNVRGVYAIGDCANAVMLAHVASAQGEVAAENAMGGNAVYSPLTCPSCIYTFPEFAAVGLTEEAAKAKAIPYRMGRFPLRANGRALIQNGGCGMVKVIVGDAMDEVLGVHICGPGAAELIGACAAYIGLEATAEEIIGTVHAHPTVSEAVREAALSAQGRALHIVNAGQKR